jgi:macrolide transport system ATP-binding/permease protein
MQVLEIRNLSKSFGAKVILDDLSLGINQGDRIGLVGENGTGKTTLAQIVIGVLSPDGGQVRTAANVEIGYLPQEAQFTDATTIRTFMAQSTGRRSVLAAQLSTLETQMSASDLSPEALTALLDQYGTAQAEFARLGGYETDYHIDQVLTGLDLAALDRDRPLHTLSGGEKTRVMMAALLLSAPPLLVLDEPTNHLDFAALEWLETYLEGYPGALFVISHDRRFLNRVVTQIAELSPESHKLTIYAGNYDFYLAEREQLRAQQQTQYEEQQAEIKRLNQLIKAKTYSPRAIRPPKDNDKFLANFRQAMTEQSATRDIKAARRRIEQIEAEAVDRPARRWQINPDFAPEAFGSQDVIRLTEVGKSFGERMLFTGVTATIKNGERIVIVAPNGAGKTTLLSLILGVGSPDSGTIRVATGAKIGYLDQEQESLDPTSTVLEAFSRDLPGTEAERRASLHKYGLFKEAQVFQPIESLSVGQKRKLQIARLIATGANLLLLDEPTNHLDLESVEQFEAALCAFHGTVLAISHDRRFIERVATRVWRIVDGRVVMG